MTARCYCWRTVIIVGALLASAIAAIAQDVEIKKTFEGVMEVQVQNTERVQLLTFSVKNGRIRVEPADAADAAQVILVDHPARRVVVLLPPHEQYIEMDLSGEGARQQSGLQKTDLTDEIQGYYCEQFTLKSKQEEVEIWATKELGSAGTLLTTVTAQTLQIPSWQTELFSLGYFPLKVVIRDASGYDAAKFEVNSIQKKALGDFLFRIPKGYEKVDKDVLEPKQPNPKKKRDR